MSERVNNSAAGGHASLAGIPRPPVVTGGGGVTLVSPGTGISVTGTVANPVVNNTGVLDVTAGTGGVIISGTTQHPVVNIFGGFVQDITAGPGIAVTGTAPHPIVSNTGVLGVAAGTGGVTITGTAQNPVVNVPAAIPSVLDVTSGPGISVTGTAQHPIVNNTGVLVVAAGTGGITVTGTAQNPIVNMPAPIASVLDVTSGPGISITGTAQHPIVNNTGVLDVTAGAAGIVITGTAQHPVVNNTGVISVQPGTGISITGPAANPIVNVTPGSSLLATYVFMNWTPYLSEPYWLGSDNGGNTGRLLAAGSASEASFLFVNGLGKNGSFLCIGVYASDYTCSTPSTWSFDIYKNGVLVPAFHTNVNSVLTTPAVGFQNNSSGALALTDGVHRIGVVLSTTAPGAVSGNLRAQVVVTVWG